jgi:hypothetical protein
MVCGIDFEFGEQWEVKAFSIYHLSFLICH